MGRERRMHNFMGKRIAIIFIIALIGMFAITIGIKKAFPIKYLNYVEHYTQNSDIDPLFVMTVMKVESNFNSNATSPKNARGLMQIIDSTAQWVNESVKIKNYSTKMLYNPENNIQIGVWYLKWLKDKYQDMDLVIAAYNAGHGNVTSWLKDETLSKDGKVLHTIPFEETSNYLVKVKFVYGVYKVVYNNLGWLINLV